MVKSSLLVLFSICLWNICNCTDFFGSFGNNRNFQKPRKTDYYDTLGVDSSATAHDIKKAYRKSVITNHPDKGGDPEEFKVIAAAYEVLSDPVKKSQYDAGSDGNIGAGFDAFSGDNSALFDTLFGFGRSFHLPTVYNLPLTLEDIYVGKSIGLTMGGGEDRGGTTRTIMLPRGLQDKQECLIRGQPQQGSEGAATSAGDIILRVIQLPHTQFIRSKHDLVVKIQISLKEAAFGFSRAFPFLDGSNVTVRSTANKLYKVGDVLLVKGKGMPIESSSSGDTVDALAAPHTSFGNLIVQIDALLPWSSCNTLSGLKLSPSEKTALHSLLEKLEGSDERDNWTDVHSKHTKRNGFPGRSFMSQLKSPTESTSTSTNDESRADAGVGENGRRKKPGKGLGLFDAFFQSSK